MKRTASARGQKAVFLDKDGTLVEDVPFNVDPARLRFTPGAPGALRRLADAGFALVVITNQPGVALGRFSAAEWTDLCQALENRVREEAGVLLQGIYACLHAAGPGGIVACRCRKPASGLLQEAAEALDIDLHASWMVGDILHDVEAGHRAGCRAVLLDRGGETEWLRSRWRWPEVVCHTLEEATDAILSAA